MKGTNAIAMIFDWSREVIEAAETPFSKLAVFILPILAPLVPAFMTTMHLQKLLEDIFSFNYALQISWAMSIITGLVLEMLGYVGAITFIRSLFQYVKSRNENLILPVFLNGAAYLFYVVAMWLINYQLGRYFETPSIVNAIFGLLSFITIPTGLLAANHLSQRAEDEERTKLRSEDREYKLERLRIKEGVTGNAKDGKPQKEKKAKMASHFKDRMLADLNEAYDRNGTVLSPIELAKRYNLDYDRSKGFISGLRTNWARSRGIELQRPAKN